MSNTKHTPGPWRIEEDAQGPCMIMHPTKKGVAIASLTEVFRPSEGFVEIESPGAPERTANAKLIAVAPELLEALKELLSIYRDTVGLVGTEQNSTTVKAHNAIAKAEGATN